jgi:TetR/AcrR family transcriptional regulator, transcriptional repressor for nem operon
MGHSKAQKTRTHKRIVSIASKRFREKGLAGFGIAELMKEAGLTAGGFYKHFDSRDDLVAEAVSSAFGGWKRRVDAAKAGGPSVSLAKLINDYLSEAHRDNPGTGCAFSALAAEIGRSHERTRALTTEQVRNDIQLIAGLIPDNDPHAARSQAILTFSALVGAMSLARAVSDEALSREILKTVAERLPSAASAFESEDGAFADQERGTAQDAEAAVDETPW